MGSSDPPRPPPALPLPHLPPLPLPLAVALVICSLAAPGHALPQDSSAAQTASLGSACSTDVNCDPVTEAVCLNSTCQCPGAYPIANGNECLAASGLDGTCKITTQCTYNVQNSYCSSSRCVCKAKYKTHEYNDKTTVCIPMDGYVAQETPVDPVMIGILVSLVLMFLIICIVLQLFSKARFRQNRTILNSANPRLMNSSFLKGSTKLGSAGGARGRRGSRGSLNTVPEGGQDEKTGGGGGGADPPTGSGSGSGSDPPPGPELRRAGRRRGGTGRNRAVDNP